MTKEVAIDDNHCSLIYSLIICQKPSRVLEFGFGFGASAGAVRQALEYNQIPFQYTIVDNWQENGGVMSDRALAMPNTAFVQADESKFVANCQEQYDFIICDADHDRTQDNWLGIYENLLYPGGIVILHDVYNSSFPRLREMVQDCMERGLRHVVFNQSSRNDERCHRGLLVVFKPWFKPHLEGYLKSLENPSLHPRG